MKLRAKLGALLGPRMPEVYPFLARFLAVKVDPDAEAQVASLRPEQLAGAVMDAFRTRIEALGSTRPVVLAVDDFHWASVASR